MPHRALVFFALLPAFARAAPPLKGEVAVSPKVTVAIELHEEPKGEDRVDFSLAAQPPQSENALGDRFHPFQKNGQTAYFHSANLFGDRNRQIFVRLIMIPMGVIRVFRFNEASQKIERMTFGAKKEDGLPIPVLAPVNLEESGDLTYEVKRKNGKSARFRLHWNGKDYELPAKEVH
jgi:hypothetical protein